MQSDLLVAPRAAAALPLKVPCRPVRSERGVYRPYPPARLVCCVSSKIPLAGLRIKRETE